MDELLDNSDLANKLSRNALARFESEFTWDHVAAQYEMLLRKSLRPYQPRTDTAYRKWWGKTGT
jgi:glycosyltransferase involved in cell wall biosynthesis